MKLDPKVMDKLRMQAYRNNQKVAKVLTATEAAGAVRDVLENDIVAQGLIKLLLSFSCIEYITRKKHGRPEPERDLYIETAIEIGFQWYGTKWAKEKGKL